MYPVRVRADPHTTHPAPSPRTDSRHRRPTVRAHPHTTTPRATQITGPDHRIGHCASESSHNAGATPHTGTIARWRMADPPTSSHMSRVARILRHTQPAEHHRKKPKPAGIWRVVYATTYATRQIQTGSNARPPTSSRTRMPAHTQPANPPRPLPSPPASAAIRMPVHTQLAEHHRAQPQPSDKRRLTYTDTYATCGRPTVTIRNSPNTAGSVCHDIHNPPDTTGSNARPPTSNRPRIPRHTILAQYP